MLKAASFCLFPGNCLARLETWGCVNDPELKSLGFDLRTYLRSQETAWSILSVPCGMLGTGRVRTTPSMRFSCTMSVRCGKLTSMVHYGIVKQA